MFRVYFQITYDCNYTCRHCGFDCGPGGITMSERDLERVVSHLPASLDKLTISGGEAMVAKPYLMHLLEKVMILKTQRIPDLTVSLQTNGYWVKDQTTAYRILKELLSKGVSLVEFSGDDKYHREQGLNTDNLRMEPGKPIFEALGQIYEELPPPKSVMRHGLDTILRGGDNPLPFGRAKELKSTELSKGSTCIVGKHPMIWTNNLTIDPNGDVRLCCWHIVPPIGSALEDPVDKLFKKAMRDPVLGAFLRGGLRAAAMEKGVFREEDDTKYLFHPCSICEEVFQQ